MDSLTGIRSLSEALLDGDEELVDYIDQHMGPVAAKEFVDVFNNACFQMMGFEPILGELYDNPNVFVTPMNNMSRAEIH